MAGQNSDEFIYEENDRGERVLVQSIESAQRAYLRFTNCTQRPVDIWWRDFTGKRIHYVCIQPGLARDINSYLTHPWEFTDKATQENYKINSKYIFRAPVTMNDGRMMYRTNWNITGVLRSLRNTALITIASCLKTEEDVNELDLPNVLKHELKTVINNIKTVL